MQREERLFSPLNIWLTLWLGFPDRAFISLSLAVMSPDCCLRSKISDFLLALSVMMIFSSMLWF
jgi:hypothetical protein